MLKIKVFILWAKYKHLWARNEFRIYRIFVWNFKQFVWKALLLSLQEVCQTFLHTIPTSLFSIFKNFVIFKHFQEIKIHGIYLDRLSSLWIGNTFSSLNEFKFLRYSMKAINIFIVQESTRVIVSIQTNPETPSPFYFALLRISQGSRILKKKVHLWDLWFK